MCPVRYRRPTVATTAGPAFLTGAPGTRTRVSTRGRRSQPVNASQKAASAGKSSGRMSRQAWSTRLRCPPGQDFGGGRTKTMSLPAPTKQNGRPAGELIRTRLFWSWVILLPGSWPAGLWLRHRRREGRGGTPAGSSWCAELADKAGPMAVVAWRTGRTLLGAVRGYSQ